MSEPVLFIDDQDRYDRLRLISWWDQERIRQARVLVVGAGALGNEVIKNLVLLGIGTIYLIDFDLIEASNLSRSVFFRDSDRGQPKACVLAARAQELNPDSRVIPLHGNVMLDIGIGLIKSLDVVVGCLDNREARLWVNRLCWKANIPWIDGGIQELSGVVKVYMPPDGACYECTMTANDYRLIQLRYSCPLLKREDIQAGRVPTAPTIASMIGAWQVQELLKLLHKLPTDSGTALVFNGFGNQSYKSKLPRRDDCLSHETYEPVIDSPLTHQATIGQLKEWSRPLAGSDISVVLDRDWVETLSCDHCLHQELVHRPALSVTLDEAMCKCGQVMRPQMRCEIPTTDEFEMLTLSSLGIADWDVLKLVSANGQEWYISLEPIEGTHRPALPCQDPLPPDVGRQPPHE
ncbi:MAG: ThiF family adenylyltransferase [Planctomycetaceae bacterium]|nr:ThiF family adenylyltransferase [Planctomycetaceae bacterium]